MNQIFKKFLSYYRPYKKIFATVLIAAILSSGVSLLIPLCTRYITSNLVNLAAAEAARQILTTGGIMAILVIIQVALDSFMDYRGHIMGAMMERDIRNELYSHYQKLSFSFFDNNKPGELMSRLTNDLHNLSELYHHGPEDLLFFSIRFVGAFAIMFTINSTLALIVALFIPPMAIFTLLISKKLRIACKQSYEKIGEINSNAEDCLAGIRVVKAFSGEERERARFSTINNLFFGSRKTIYKYESICFQGIQLIIHLITVAVIVFGGIGISGKTLTLPDLIAFLLYVGYVTNPIQHLVHMIGQFQEGFASFERFNDMTKITPEINDCKNSVELQNPQGKVEFKNVSFSYASGLEPVLKNVNLTVNKGEQIGLIGSSGVGKSTLCALIPRFYDVSAGAVLVDGIDVRQLSQNSLRQAIAVVEQSIYLFSGTVKENIAYGKEDASDLEIIEAAKNAGAHHFITALPMGYNTDIGVKGVKLSGGQKQRISIARAFLKNPAIIVFDEATSSLDSESEALVHSSLKLLSKGRTSFIITHRHSTLENCTRILKIENGNIV